MASVINDPGGRRRIQFVGGDGARRAIRLGQLDRKSADAICRHVEALLGAKIGGQPIPKDSASWLSSIGDKLRDKLAAAGLVEPRAAVAVATLGALIAEYKSARTDVKAGTATNLDQTGKKMVEFFGEAKAVTALTEADAENFYRKLLEHDLATNTARRHAGRAKQYLAYAVRRRIITSNPFGAVKVATRGNPDRQEYVSVETVGKVLEACPSVEWRLIVALSRYAGLRCPSEHLALTWGDVLWDRNRFVVRSPKTEGYAGKSQRLVPIFPEVYPYLRDAFEAAEPGQVQVIARNRADGGQGNGQTTNWRTQMLRIVLRAGITPWPRLFHGMRAACQTDLANKFPAHVVCGWLGNSVAVANEHYLQTTEDHFAKAVQSGAKSGADGAQNQAQTGADAKRQERTNSNEVLEVQASRPLLSAPVSTRTLEQVTLWRFELQFLP